MTGETTANGSSGALPSSGYTYDHNGNRLTQTSNGTQTQSLAYNAHDILASGTDESDTYDYNGNLLTQTLNGQTTKHTCDDEDRLISIAVPNGPTDSFTYNGLGLRVGKADSTGTFNFLCGGTSPARPPGAEGNMRGRRCGTWWPFFIVNTNYACLAWFMHYRPVSAQGARQTPVPNDNHPVLLLCRLLR